SCYITATCMLFNLYLHVTLPILTAARTDVNNLMQALKLYRLDNQRYPTGEQGLQALVARPGAGPVPPNWKPYLEKLPNDPWGRRSEEHTSELQSRDNHVSRLLLE